ncbi:g6916 [Coccomyxa elongata]
MQEATTQKHGGWTSARMGESGTSLLETPPFVIAVVFLFFLVVTLGFEKILHHITHYLKKRGKHGLVAAMNNMTNELMLLGVATLLLLTFQKDIGQICIPSKAYAGKNWLDHVNGCACCLTRTAGVSPCYLRAKGCQDFDTLDLCCWYQGDTRKNKVCNAIWDSEGALQNAGEMAGLEPSVVSSGSHQRRLYGGAEAVSASADDVVCDGRVQVDWPECGNKPNMRPAIGAAALHQVHLFIFEMALVHILGGILLILLASLRVRFWRKWTEDNDAFTAEARRACDRASVKEVEMANRGKSAAAPGGTVSMGASGGAPEAQGRGDLEAAEGGTRNFLDHLEVPRMGKWRGRPLHLNRVWGGVVEMFWCVLLQFNVISPVTKEQFSLMRASFYLTHHIDSGAQFDFMGYLRQSMEDDYASLVGLGLAMWVFLIMFVLLSSVWGWCVWFFTLLAGVVLLIVNTKLVWIARYVTRGGMVHRLKPGVFWFNRPWLLLPVIKYLVFFNTFVFANSIFFASQFGRHSCFFSKTGFQGAVPLSWWSVLLVNIIYFVWLCHLTLPLYSLVVHMGSDIKHEALPAELRERLQAARAHYDQTSAKHSGSIFNLRGGQKGEARGEPLVTTPHSTSKHA